MNIMVTGATSGIGKALALAYAAAGNKVIACGRSRHKLEQLMISSERCSLSTCTGKAQY